MQRSLRPALLLLAVVLGGCGDSMGPGTPPVIQVDPSLLSMSGTARARDLIPATVQVAAVGGRIPLTGLSLGDVVYEGEARGWLEVELSGSDAPAAVTLRVRPRELVAGSYRATVAVRSSLPGVEPAVLRVELELAPAPAQRVGIRTQPGGAVSGRVLATQPVVELLDAEGFPTPVGGEITAQITSGGGTLKGTATVRASAGVAAFTDLRIDGGGAHALIFAVGGLEFASSLPFEVEQRPAALSLEKLPGGAVSGISFTDQPVVQILDEAGLVASTGVGATLPVTASISDGSGRLVGIATVPAEAGVANFRDLRIDGAGPHRLTFSVAEPALSVQSPSFTVDQRPVRLELVRQPAGAVSGRVLNTQPVLHVLDDAGVRATLGAGATLEVTVARVDGTAALQGTTAVRAVEGVVTFGDLRLDGTGTVALGFTATGVEGARSAAVVITQEPAALAVTVQPGGSFSGDRLRPQPKVQILDDAGLPLTTGPAASLRIEAAVASGVGVLGGARTVQARLGLAEFAELMIDGVGIHALAFTTAFPALRVLSEPFRMTPPPASVTVTLPRPFVTGNAVQAATAVVRDTEGATLDLPVTWSVGDPRVARNSPTGLVQALGRGTTTVTARIGTLSGNATLQVGETPAAFGVTLRELTPLAPEIRSVFDAAAARWSGVIRGDLDDVSVEGLDVSFCGSQPDGTTLTETIDDLLIFISVEPIDGPGGVLGSAGPCYIRTRDNLPVVGDMRFDAADLESLQARGLLEAVILHEMGHVLGIGTLWNVFGFLQRPSPVGDRPACEAYDPIYIGDAGQWGFASMSTGYEGEPVPVENCFGPGTRNGHWRESVLGRELMTGFLSNTTNPLSPLTALSLLDLGYVVDNAGADPAPWLLIDGPQIRIPLIELPPRSPRYLDERGRPVPAPPRH